MTLARVVTGYRTSGRVTRHDTQIVSLHGDPFDAVEEEALGASVRRVSTMVDGLHATGHQVHQPWTGACWATDVDAYGHGGHGLSVVDTLCPDGEVHLIGSSMGGYNSVVWASRHPDRVASLTLNSPALDVMDIYDRLVGNAILGPVADEIATCWGGSSSATRADIATAVTTAEADYDSLVAALAPLADRIWLVCATNDNIGIAPAAQDLAAALDLPADRAVFFDTGGTTDTHPAPYRPDLGWDNLTTLRQVTQWA